MRWAWDRWWPFARISRLPGAAWTRLGLISIPLALILGVIRLVYNRLWLSYVVNETVVALALAYLVAKTAEGFDGPTGRLLSLPPLQYVGKISYGIYLYHLFVLQAFWKFLSVAHLPLLDKGPLLFLILTPTTVAMAALSWKLLEEPLNGLKRHFPYQPEGLRGGAESSFLVFSVKERPRRAYPMPYGKKALAVRHF